MLFATINNMNDNTYDDIAKELQATDPENPSSVDEASAGTEPQQAEESNQQAAQNFAFFTPTEAGIRATDPNDIPAAPRPQPGMTFTPTGGSVSDVQHQLNTEPEDNNATVVEPTDTAQ